MSRRPPSQRDPEYAPQRIDRALVQRVPGTGRMASAAPAGGGNGGRAEIRGAGTPGGNPGVRFARDRFELSAAAPVLSLSFLPIPASPHVYLNGIEQDEGADYTVDGRRLTVLVAMGALVGDVVDVRYAYLSALPSAVQDPVAPGIVDTFDREDGPTLFVNRSDGGLWDVDDDGWEILDGRAVRVSGASTIHAEYGEIPQLRIEFDTNQTDDFFYATSIKWAAADGSSTNCYALLFHVSENYMALSKDLDTVVSTHHTGYLPDSSQHVVITYDQSTGDVVVTWNGDVIIEWTDPVPLVGTWCSVGHSQPHAVDGWYIDNFEAVPS